MNSENTEPQRPYSSSKKFTEKSEQFESERISSNQENEVVQGDGKEWYQNEVSAETNMDQGKMQVDVTIVEPGEDDFQPNQDSYLSKVLQSSQSSISVEEPCKRAETLNQSRNISDEVPKLAKFNTDHNIIVEPPEPKERPTTAVAPHT